MYDIYLKKIGIEKVRHLENVEIPISENTKKHLIITGKNGSGKTSLLQALSTQLNFLTVSGDFKDLEDRITRYSNALISDKQNGSSENKIVRDEQTLRTYKIELENAKCGLKLEFNVPFNGIKAHFDKGEFILAYYQATRKLNSAIPKHVEKITLKENYLISESPRNEFVKYILDLKVTEALARSSGNIRRADEIHSWFDQLEQLLKNIFDDDTTELRFDEETFAFSICQKGREPFNFNVLSDGFAAVLDIVVDIMIRMEKHIGGSFQFDLPGIVLVDEIETHLHLELQKNVLHMLTTLFPNIQFIVTTHSPFILNCAENAAIFDLENKTFVENGLSDVPYEGIVKGYFEVDDLSRELRKKYSRFKELIEKKEITDDEMEEISSLELYLDEIPDYLAIGITTEYRRLKGNFEAREDL